MPIYFADNILDSGKLLPDVGDIQIGITATAATMLATTGAAGFLIGDIICLAIIPGRTQFTSYNLYIPELDTGSTVTLDLGDNVIQSGATTITSGASAQATGATPGTSFTLTASASTASFTATNGLLMVNGMLIQYGALSGSTFTTCYASQPNVTIPPGSQITQITDYNAFQAVAVIGQSAAGILTPNYNLTGTTFVTATVVLNALPKPYITPYNTWSNAVGSASGSAQIGPQYLLMRIHASPSANPVFTTQAISGWYSYRAV